MIEHISGKIIRKQENSLVVDVSGVGYGVEIPSQHAEKFPSETEPVNVWIFTKVREDEIKLYGFSTYALRECFAILVQINGVGPKVALGILGEMSIGGLCQAIAQRDASGFERVQGVGKRTAAKILLELQPKLERLLLLDPQKGAIDGTQADIFSAKSTPGFVASVREDLKSALANLGMNERDWKLALKRAQNSFVGDDFAELVRFSLKVISEEKKVGRDQKASSRGNQKGPSLDLMF